MSSIREQASSSSSSITLPSSSRRAVTLEETLLASLGDGLRDALEKVTGTMPSSITDRDKAVCLMLRSDFKHSMNDLLRLAKKSDAFSRLVSLAESNHPSISCEFFASKEGSAAHFKANPPKIFIRENLPYQSALIALTFEYCNAAQAGLLEDTTEKYRCLLVESFAQDPGFPLLDPFPQSTQTCNDYAKEIREIEQAHEPSCRITLADIFCSSFGMATEVAAALAVNLIPKGLFQSSDPEYQAYHEERSRQRLMRRAFSQKPAKS